MFFENVKKYRHFEFLENISKQQIQHEGLFLILQYEINSAIVWMHPLCIAGPRSFSAVPRAPANFH